MLPYYAYPPGLSTWIGAVLVIAEAIFMIYRETRRKRDLTSIASKNEES